MEFLFYPENAVVSKASTASATKKFYVLVSFRLIKDRSLIDFF